MLPHWLKWNSHQFRIVTIVFTSNSDIDPRQQTYHDYVYSHELSGVILSNLRPQDFPMFKPGYIASADRGEWPDVAIHLIEAAALYSNTFCSKVSHLLWVDLA